jgi:uncharacterized membrane protein YgcG
MIYSILSLIVLNVVFYLRSLSPTWYKMKILDEEETSLLPNLNWINSTGAEELRKMTSENTDLEYKMSQSLASNFEQDWLNYINKKRAAMDSLCQKELVMMVKLKPYLDKEKELEEAEKRRQDEINAEKNRVEETNRKKRNESYSSSSSSYSSSGSGGSGGSDWGGGGGSSSGGGADGSW